MAVRSVTTNVAQEVALSYLTRKENARRAAENPPLPPVTVDQVADAVFDRAFQDVINQARNGRLNDRVVALAAADPSTVAQVDSLLGVS